ncbi:MAG: alkaline phosphatase family protein [Thermodesulfobacteriota bacterium]
MASDLKIPPFIILGIDAGDPGFIREWSAHGYLPSISSIIKDGIWGKTSGPELVTEHGVWISLLSGISRSRHGYHYFRQLKPGTYDLESVTGLDIDAPPFWSHLIGTGKKSLIVDAADIRLYEGLTGIQVANWATHHNWDPYHFVTASEPPEIIDEIGKKFGSKLLTVENHNSTFEQDMAIYRKLLENVRIKGEMCRYLLKQDRFDISLLIFAESHAANHQFWKYHPGMRAPGDRDCELTYAIRDVYAAIDNEIGLILKLFDNPNVCIVSSVGMEDDYPNAALSEVFCRQLGFQASPEGGSYSVRPIDIARRLLPESVRMALSRHMPRDKREQLVSDRFRTGTDWSRTTAFSIPVSYTSFIRVNLREREPQGIVEPGNEYHSLIDRIAGELNRLVDPVTVEPAVVSVSKTVEIFKCDPHEFLPDIFVEWKPGRFMERVVHPETELIQKKPEFFRRSDHSSYGFFALSGPSVIARGEIDNDNIEVLDIAPTFMSLLGEPVPDIMHGHTLLD